MLTRRENIQTCAFAAHDIISAPLDGLELLVGICVRCRRVRALGSGGRGGVESAFWRIWLFIGDGRGVADARSLGFSELLLKEWKEVTKLDAGAVYVCVSCHVSSRHVQQ